MRNTRDVRKEIIELSGKLISLNKELEELIIREIERKDREHLQDEV